MTPDISNGQVERVAERVALKQESRVPYWAMALGCSVFAAACFGLYLWQEETKSERQKIIMADLDSVQSEQANKLERLIRLEAGFNALDGQVKSVDSTLKQNYQEMRIEVRSGMADLKTDIRALSELIEKIRKP